jgi:hypothetical protein
MTDPQDQATKPQPEPDQEPTLNPETVEDLDVEQDLAEGLKGGTGNACHQTLS